MYKVYFAIKRMKRKNNNSSIKDKILNKILAYIEAYYNLYVVKAFSNAFLKRLGVTKKKRKQKLIVSLTSYPKRIDTIWITIETLLRQSMKPDEIVLWLAKEQFKGLESLPIELLEQQKRGLSIRFCDDLKSHKKYFYVMQEYPEDIIILFDDDMFYPRDTIKKLWKMHQKHPKDICCMTTQVMEPSFESLPSGWRNPRIDERIESSDKVQIFTGSGSLFVPEALAKEVFRKDLLLKLCPYADDLWITYMAYRAKTRITSMKQWRAFPITIYGTSQDSLWYINGQDGKNDEQWKNLITYFAKE